MESKNIKIALAILIIIAISLFFVFGRDSVVNYPSKNIGIVAFGDSLVVGVGSTPGNDFVSLLSKKINQPITNLGVSGNTTAEGLERLSEVIALKPKVVLLLLGGNDFLRKVPATETFKNLESIIDQIQNTGSIVILLGVRGGILTDSYDSLFEELSEKKGTAYVPNVLKGLVGDMRFMSDAIHPNDIGYLKITDRVYPVLKKMIE
jgi:lysophospholipase L1-like esterase